MRCILNLMMILLIPACSIAQQKMDNIPASLNAEIRSKAFATMSKLGAFKQWLASIDAVEATVDNHVLFRWPLRSNANYDMIPENYMLNNYMDVDRDTGFTQKDWYCYNMNYRGHEGNDYSLYPFFWRMMDNKNVFACAGAAGVVIGVRDDLTNDYNCLQPGEDNNANYVALLHSDSSITRYLHIKRNSARVAEGQFVEEGALLANIGSSGHTSNPHLHFDLQFFRAYNNNYNFVEPFKRPDDPASNLCNRLTNTTWWKNQKTYINPKFNRIMTHNGVPQLHGDINTTANNGNCFGEEDAKIRNNFSPGEQITIGAALVHVRVGDELKYIVYYPNGVAWASLSRTVPLMRNSVPVTFRNHIYLTNNFTLPANAPTGTYKIKAEITYRPFDPSDPYQPETDYVVSPSVYHYFTVGCLASQTLAGAATGDNGYIVSNDLNSTQQVSGRAIYQSGNYVKLNPGFVAASGAVFKAKIGDCNSSD